MKDLTPYRTQAAMIHAVGGAKLTGSGTYVARCPGHTDATPSLTIYPDGHAYCYGCGRRWGDAIDMMAENRGFTLAQVICHVEELFPHLGPVTVVRRAPPLQGVPEDLADVWSCLSHPEVSQPAFDYWGDRGISEPVVLALHLRVITDPLLLPTLLKERVGIERCRELRLLNRRMWAFAMHPLIIPGWWPERGVTALQFRRVDNRHPRFLSSRTSGLIMDPRQKAGRIWLCEGAGDTASIVECGKRAIGIMGIESWRRALPAVMDLTPTSVVVAFDRNDGCEDQVAGHVVDWMRKQAIPAERVTPVPPAKDWSEALQSGILKPHLLEGAWR